MPKAVLVSDFDGTMTTNDFYKLAVAHLLPSGADAPWQDYRAGKITHFEALREIFSRIRVPESAMLDMVGQMQPDPELARALNRLQAAGWHVVVASAGCDWYIRRVLAQAGIPVTGNTGRDPGARAGVELHANFGTYSPESGLRMTAPVGSPFFCPEIGVDKAAIVRLYRERGATVAFAGDGFADLPAALATPPGLRFARADLAGALLEQNQGARPFNRWSEVADNLLASGGVS